MKKFILLILISSILSPTFALEVVYPKCKKTTINANSTFFVGNTDPYKVLKINGELVNFHPSGNFASVVKLNNGVNVFTLKSGDETLIYEIIKPEITPSVITSPNIYTDFQNQKLGKISSNKTPLRTSPQNFGINRLAHLQKDTELAVIGENNDFYKIKLTDKDFGWVSKKQVELMDEEISPANILNVISTETLDYEIYEIQLDKKIPFKIEENMFSITLYNINSKDTTYKFVPTVKHKLFGYSGEFIDNKFVLKIRKYPVINPLKPLEGVKIVIDAGHGGSEIGTIGCSGIKEKDLNLTISWKLKEELERRGATVYMTRMFDIKKDLNDRVEYANDKDAPILISIHADALPDGQDPLKHSGTSIYYYYNQAKPLADSIMQSVTKFADVNNNKVRQGSLALVRNTNALSILIETAYLINPDDNYKLEQETFQNNFVKGVAIGIEEYLIGR